MRPAAQAPRGQEAAIATKGAFFLEKPAQDSLLVGRYEWGDEMLLGAFNFHWSPGRSPCPLPTASTRTCWRHGHGPGGRAPAPLRPLLLHVTGQRRAQAAFREHEG